MIREDWGVRVDETSRRWSGVELVARRRGRVGEAGGVEVEQVAVGHGLERELVSLLLGRQRRSERRRSREDRHRRVGLRAGG